MSPVNHPSRRASKAVSPRRGAAWQRSRWSGFLALLLPMLLLACAVNPVTGKRQISLMSESQMESLGESSDTQIVDQYGLVDDPQLAAYIDSLGQSIIPVSHVPDERFQFRLLDDPVVNAFAVPGGYIYITRGILAYLNDQAALVGVMGHEVGHVAARHSAQQYTKQVLIGAGLSLGAALNSTVAHYAQLGGAAAQLLMLKYSRDDERQADRLGVEYASKLHYDTHEMADFFHTLDSLYGGSAGLANWTSTHPDPGERYQTVNTLTQEWQAKLPGPFEVDRNRYLSRLEGLVFGADPRQGVVKGDQFVHPALRFRFPVPTDWQVVNMARQVQMASPQGDAAVFFGAEATEDPATAARDFAQKAEVTVGQTRSLSIGGWPAIQQRGTLSASDQQQTPLTLLSTFIKRSDHLFVFHALSASSDFDRFRSTFENVSQGFAALTDPALLNLKPVTLHIIKTPRSAPFSEQVAAYPLPEDVDLGSGGLALLNGHEPQDSIPAGTLLKVLRR
jgi:predicted Zn-dependent protease